jgi:Ala-tRNA(Pro) deacylase
MPDTVSEVTRVFRTARTPYQLLPHAPTECAADEAAVLHLEPGEVAKTVVLVTPEERVRAVIPASERLDLERVRDAIGGPADIQLASEHRLATDYPMFALGAVPPVGGPPGDRVMLDRRLASRGSVVFEAGAHDVSLRVMTADLRRLSGATVGDLCRQD